MLIFRILSVFSALMLITAVGGKAWAGKSNDTLVWASTEEPPGLDFYYDTTKETSVIAHQVWDTLLVQDLKTGTFKPHLAESFEFIDPQTIDVVLRTGIKFHNGEDFSADDVVYTLTHVLDPANKVRVPQKVDFIKSAEKTGEHSVRIHLVGPFPAARTFFSAGIPIYPNEYYDKVGPAGMAEAPIGTGPYKIEKVEKGKRVTMVRNEEYFGGARSKANIGRLVFRPIPERTTQIAELLTGGVDWIWNVLPEQAERLSEMPDLTVKNAEAIRIGFLKMDAAGVTGANPFQELEVRKAINHAVDRKSIVDNLVGESARVIHAPCFPEQFACEDKLAERYDYDVEQARNLLAEAGYPDGFETAFHACRDRSYVEALIGYLADVGVRTDLRWSTCSKMQELTAKGETVFSFYALGSGGIMDAFVRTSKDWDLGAFDYAKDEEVHATFREGDLQTDPEKRKELYADAIRITTEKAYWVPLFSYSTYYAYTKDLEFEPTTDETPRFAEAKWK